MGLIYSAAFVVVVPCTVVLLLDILPLPPPFFICNRNSNNKDWTYVPQPRTLLLPASLLASLAQLNCLISSRPHSTSTYLADAPPLCLPASFLLNLCLSPDHLQGHLMEFAHSLSFDVTVFPCGKLGSHYRLLHGQHARYDEVSPHHPHSSHSPIHLLSRCGRLCGRHPSQRLRQFLGFPWNG